MTGLAQFILGAGVDRSLQVSGDKMERLTEGLVGEDSREMDQILGAMDSGMQGDLAIEGIFGQGSGV